MVLNHSLVQHYYLCNITKIAFLVCKKIVQFYQSPYIFIGGFDSNDRISSLLLAMAFDSNPIRQHKRIKANKKFSGMENHSDCGFVSAWF